MQPTGANARLNFIILNKIVVLRSRTRGLRKPLGGSRSTQSQGENMSPEYTVEAADGFYIARNGEGVLDLADPQDYEFAEFVCAALNQAAQQNAHLTGLHCPACTSRNEEIVTCARCGTVKSAPQVA